MRNTSRISGKTKWNGANKRGFFQMADCLKNANANCDSSKTRKHILHTPLFRRENDSPFFCDFFHNAQFQLLSVLQVGNQIVKSFISMGFSVRGVYQVLQHQGIPLLVPVAVSAFFPDNPYIFRDGLIV